MNANLTDPFMPCVVIADGRGGYVAFLERVGGEAATIDLLLEVRRKLAAVAGIGPSTVGCLPRNTLPKTPSGKIRRNAVAADLDNFKRASSMCKEF